MSKEFGTYLRNRRGKESLRDFAKKLNISHSQLESLEKGFEVRTGRPPNISLNLLNKISKGLGISMPHLIKYFENDPTFSRRKFSYVRPKIYSPEVKEMILSDLKKIGNITKVAEKYHISERTVSAIKAQQTTNHDREAILEDYKRIKNTKAICSKYNIAQQTLSDWINEFIYTPEYKQEVLSHLKQTKDLQETSNYYGIPKQNISAWLRQTITPEMRKAILEELDISPIEEVAYRNNIAINTLKRWRSEQSRENFYKHYSDQPN